MNSTIGIKITNEEANALTSDNVCGFAEDNIVLTDSGYTNIKDLYVNCLVMGQEGDFHKVLNKTVINQKQTIYVHGMGIDYIKCTPNQQFLVKELERRLCSKQYSANDRPSGLRLFSKPKFVSAKDLNSKHYFGIQILSSKEDKIFETDNLDFWRLCGIYVGDGCLNTQRTNVIITCNPKDIEQITPILERLGYEYKTSPKQYERNCFNLTIKNEYFAEFVLETFGMYSYGKNIPYDVLNLPTEQLSAFYNGFLQSDGCTLSTNTNISQFTTVNRFLNSATSLIINKIYRRPTRLYYQIRPDKYIIEGRVVNQRNTYQLRFLKEQQKFEHAFIEDNYIWFPFTKLEIGEFEDVYNFELENCNSCIVGNAIAKV